MLTKNINTKLGNLHLNILNKKRWEDLFAQLLSYSFYHVRLLHAGTMRFWRTLEISQPIPVTLQAHRSVSNVDLGFWGTVLAGLLAVPLFFFFYLFLTYGGIGSNHVDFASHITIPIFNRVIENPFRQYINWYWLTKSFGAYAGHLTFGVIAFKGLKKKYKVLAVFYFNTVLGIAVNEVFAPHGQYEFTNIFFAGIFATGVYAWNGDKIRILLSKLMNSEASSSQIKPSVREGASLNRTSVKQIIN